MASNGALLAGVIFLGLCLAIRFFSARGFYLSEFGSDRVLFEESAFKKSICLARFLSIASLQTGPCRKVRSCWTFFLALHWVCNVG